MTNPYAALRQCVEALELHNEYPGSIWPFQVKATRNAALTAARAALDAQPEPFGYVTETGQGIEHFYRKAPYLDNAIKCTPVFAAPPQRQPLTDEQIERLCGEACASAADAGDLDLQPLHFARAVERAHGIGQPAK